MSHGSDPRQPSTAKPYKPPSIASQDLPPDYSSFLAIMFGVAGVMLRVLSIDGISLELDIINKGSERITRHKGLGVGVSSDCCLAFVINKAIKAWSDSSQCQGYQCNAPFCQKIELIAIRQGYSDRGSRRCSFLKNQYVTHDFLPNIPMYKLGSWLAIICCAQSLANMRNVENDLKQIIMAMTFAIMGLVSNYFGHARQAQVQS
ncbi:hypothetical protein SUGI_0818350 [Cryptomeria japonica]|nr:hypothetical protein SUGI_0818350 [Cryptomeria japonica]